MSLNYWVAKSECELCHPGFIKSYATSWDAAGPLIEREKISLHFTNEEWEASILDAPVTATARDPLVAAMRAYVLKKFGEDLPSIAESEKTPV